MTRKNCPDCGAIIGRDAYKCRCGWQESIRAVEFTAAACAYMGCNTAALVRVKDGTADVFLCPTHYPQWWSLDRIKSHGVNSGEKDNPLMREIRQRYQAARGGKAHEETRRETSGEPMVQINEFIP